MSPRRRSRLWSAAASGRWCLFVTSLAAARRVGVAVWLIDWCSGQMLRVWASALHLDELSHFSHTRAEEFSLIRSFGEISILVFNVFLYELLYGSKFQVHTSVCERQNDDISVLNVTDNEPSVFFVAIKHIRACVINTKSQQTFIIIKEMSLWTKLYSYQLKSSNSCLVKFNTISDVQQL